MKSIKTLIATAALALSAIVVDAAPTTNNETLFATIIGYSGGIPAPCTTYYGVAKMTNSSGGIVLIPPSGTTTATANDNSGYPSPYQTCITVTRKSDGHVWDNTNSVTFPVTNGVTYSVAYSVQVPYPTTTNIEAIKAQVIWQ